MCNSATETMLKTIGIIKESASKAEKEFDRRAEALQLRAGRSIDLFGGNAVSSVADIASESRKICDALYSSYQTLVKMLDDQCRPLLDQDPDISAVRRVRDLIKWLNDESEIENNFTASLNNSAYRDVASARYYPSLENKMIQTFWETKYEMIPGKAEAEQAERSKKDEEIKEIRRIRQEKVKLLKKEIEQKRKEEESKYKKACEDWSNKVAEIKKIRDDRINEAVNAAREARRADIENRYCTYVNSAGFERNNCIQKKTEAENKLPTLGFFSFGEKKATKQLIEDMTVNISRLNSMIAAAEQTYLQEKNSIEYWVSTEKAKITKNIERNFPLPPKPEKSSAQIRTSSGLTLEQIDSRNMQEIICEYMIPGKLYTISEIQESIPELADVSTQRVSALLRQMLGTRIERIEDNRRAYFRIKD